MKKKLKITSSLQDPHKVVRTVNGIQVKQPKTKTIVIYTN